MYKILASYSKANLRNTAYDFLDRHGARRVRGMRLPHVISFYSRGSDSSSRSARATAMPASPMHEALRGGGVQLRLEKAGRG